MLDRVKVGGITLSTADNPVIDTPINPAGSRKEIFGWAMLDFGNLGSYTVVLTTIFNCYFIDVVAGGAHGYSKAVATLLWTVIITVSSIMLALTGPILGAIADYSGKKKRLLLLTNASFVISIVLLGMTGPGQIGIAIFLAIVCNFMAWTSMNLAASFLPEISTRETMGRVSGIGSGLAFLGVITMLLLCMSYVGWAEHHGQSSRQFVPVSMDLIALLFVLASSPAALWLKDRTPKGRPAEGDNYIVSAFSRLRRTLAEASKFRDLYRVFLTSFVYSCGASTVQALAAVYAHDVMGFQQSQVIAMMLITSVCAAAGALTFGHLQDRFGSVATLRLDLLLWAGCVTIAYLIQPGPLFWAVAVLLGIATGGLRVTSRALVGQFSPQSRAAEFYGLFGLTVSLSYVIGPLVYGIIGYASGGNQRLAVLSTLCFFIVGLALLGTVNEKRGKLAARMSD